MKPDLRKNGQASQSHKAAATGENKPVERKPFSQTAVNPLSKVASYPKPGSLLG